MLWRGQGSDLRALAPFGRPRLPRLLRLPAGPRLLLRMHVGTARARFVSRVHAGTACAHEDRFHLRPLLRLLMKTLTT